MKAEVAQQRSLLEVAELDAELSKMDHRAGPLPGREGAVAKSLLLGPERLGLALIEDGWTIRNKIIWAKRNPMLGPGGVEIRPFYEAADLAEYLTPEELSTPREGERGKLGVA